MPPPRSTPLLLAFALSLAAGGAAVAEPIVVSDATGADAPVAAALPDGGFVVAWQSFTYDTPVIRLRTLDATGALRGPEQIVAESVLVTVARKPRLAVADDGTILVAFQVSGLTLSAVSVRRYSPQDLPLDEAKFAAKKGPAQIRFHDAAALPDGGWLVAYDRVSLTGTAPGRIEAVRLSADATLADGPFLLAPEDGESRSTPALARAGEGLIGAWSRGSVVVTRRLDATGSPLGDEEVLSVGDDPLSIEESPQPTVYAEGRAEAIWIAIDTTTHVAVLRGRKLVGGIPMGSAHALATIPFSSGIQRPALAADALGRFFVGWNQPADPGGAQVSSSVVQLFGRDGLPLDTARVLNDREGRSAVPPAAAMQPGGQYLLAWVGTSGVQEAILVEIGALGSGCMTTDTALCLTGDWFEVQAQ